jgi:hypothetical protein
MVDAASRDMKFTLAAVLGILVLVAGLSIILGSVLDIHLPLFRSAVALVLILLGVRMLFGAWAPARKGSADSTSVLFEERVLGPTSAAPARMKYDVVFGRGVIDLTTLPRDALDRTVEINSIFGAAEVRVDSATPYEVDGTAAFGETRTPGPGRSASGFGSFHYQPPSAVPPLLHIKVNSVFGSSEVIETPHAPLPAEAPATS